VGLDGRHPITVYPRLRRALSLIRAQGRSPPDLPLVGPSVQSTNGMTLSPVGNCVVVSGVLGCPEGRVISQHGVGDGDDLACHGDEDDFGGFASVLHTPQCGSNGAGGWPQRQGGHVEQPADHRAPLADPPLAAELATLAGLGEGANALSGAWRQLGEADRGGWLLSRMERTLTIRKGSTRLP
jgi:hypothetical protein